MPKFPVVATDTDAADPSGQLKFAGMHGTLRSRLTPSLPRPKIMCAPVALTLALATVVVCAGCAGTSRLGRRSAPTCAAPADVLAGVYQPRRLRVLATCRSVSGTVRGISHEQDGDLHIGLDSGGALTNAANRSKLGGELVVEFMPRDGGHLPAPKVGAHISLTGAWVLDANHGWQELHPVWSEILAGVMYRSGPRYGGSQPGAGGSQAAADCVDGSGAPCRGYGP